MSSKKSQPGAYRTRLCRPRKTPPPNVGFGVGPLPSAKHKWHIDNALDAKITAGVVHNGERGFHIHILWLYGSSISQSYRGFTDFCGICSGIPRLNTASTRTHNVTFSVGAISFESSCSVATL